MEFSSRMKDYYLANKFDFDGTVLLEVLRKTFVNHNYKFIVKQFEQVMFLDSDDGMQKKQKVLTRKIGARTDEFRVVLDTINCFLTDPF